MNDWKNAVFEPPTKAGFYIVTWYDRRKKVAESGTGHFDGKSFLNCDQSVVIAWQPFPEPAPLRQGAVYV